jgi:hypothetical protein
MSRSGYTRRDSDDGRSLDNAIRLYPTPTGAGALGDYPDHGDGVKPDNDNEDNTRCKQCGWPISDARQVQTCPFCGSDNFEGAIFEP